MYYWDEMQDKWGFDDGDAVPFAANIYRQAYIRFINAIAEHLGCTMRIVAYNRPGVHNWCRLTYLTVEDIEAHHLRPEELENDLAGHEYILALRRGDFETHLEQYGGVWTKGLPWVDKPDSLMEQAIEIAKEVNSIDMNVGNTPTAGLWEDQLQDLIDEQIAILEAHA